MDDMGKFLRNIAGEAKAKGAAGADHLLGLSKTYDQRASSQISKDPRLDRVVPKDFKHVDKFPLQALPPRQRPTQVPVIIGVNWYAEFDNPDRQHWVAKDGKLTTVRGGHCICLKPASAKDERRWWKIYDQGQEGACVGFGISRAMTILTQHIYDSHWVYNQAQKIDPWPGEGYSGTTVAAGMEVIRTLGPLRKGEQDPDEGIGAYRWATSVDEVLRALGHPNRDYVIFLNSWGHGYPHYTRMTAEVLDRLIREDGEAAIPTAR